MLAKRLFLFLVVFSLWGCPKTPPASNPVETPVDPDGGVSISDEIKKHPDWFQCTADTDCEYQEIECCDVCNGGTALVLNKKFSAEARKALNPSTCEGTVCTQMACVSQITASCQNNACTPMKDGAPIANPVTR